ncbi:DUF202 domain-containing protein [Streptomyces millisiae]|uniref:DUF202 domain-containing protein n=1 Tax=Streptomyces millisiae TaxID=3075542 RepID=A0ABU2LNY6_9ACTN|nr:DUF202 domain-containing protein [Streptomyces sp. DSM 44918]MDT0318942.1 DUF202 domain-containing protein [Streptomyces sp. DSM 44918]
MAGERDPGAQPERTRLAWRRTTLAFALVVALAGRSLVVADEGRPVALVAVAVAALLWVGFLVLAHRRLGELTDRRPGAAGGGTVLAAAGAVLATAAALALTLSGG